MKKLQHESDENALKTLKNLKSFYIDGMAFIAVVILTFIIWAMHGGGYFWPLWVIIGWGTALAVKAINLDLLPYLAEYFPFFDPNWEHKELEKLRSQTPPPENKNTPVVDKKPKSSK